MSSGRLLDIFSRYLRDIPFGISLRHPGGDILKISSVLSVAFSQVHSFDGRCLPWALIYNLRSFLSNSSAWFVLRTSKDFRTIHTENCHQGNWKNCGPNFNLFLYILINDVWLACLDTTTLVGGLSPYKLKGIRLHQIIHDPSRKSAKFRPLEMCLQWWGSFL
jgi:hypothetical protein